MKPRVATISGTFLAPGVSKNRRLYSDENIGKAVARMQSRLADNSRPITMMSHHDAGDDSTRIVGRVTAVEKLPDGRARWTADIADTAAGRDIATLAANGYLPTVSIRGSWVGDIRTETVDSLECETADDLEIDGIDFTKSPGVDAARIEDTKLAESARRQQIFESVEPGAIAVTVFEQIPAGVIEESTNKIPPKEGATQEREAPVPEEKAPEGADLSKTIAESIAAAFAARDKVAEEAKTARKAEKAAAKEAAKADKEKAVKEKADKKAAEKSPELTAESVSALVVEAVAAATVAARDSIRDELVTDGRIPVRKGLVEAVAKALEDKAPHEMTPDEWEDLKQRTSLLALLSAPAAGIAAVTPGA